MMKMTSCYRQFTTVCYKSLRENIPAAILNAKQRNVPCDPARVAALYEEHAQLITNVNALRQERNKMNQELKKTRGGDELLKGFAKEKKNELNELEERSAHVTFLLEKEACKLPNETHPETPIGNESENKILSLFGQKPTFDFKIKDHTEIVTMLNLVDFEAGRKVAGSRFVCLCNEAAFLELALVQWAMFKLRGQGFTAILPPDIANWNMVEGCGYQPRREADGTCSQIYGIEKTDLCLSGTSEIALAGMKSNSIVDAATLPLRYAAFSHCFRTEVSHGGSKLRGLYRLHQFSKVEMFAFAKPEEAESILQDFLDIQIEMYTELGLHFRIVEMASEELGAPAFRKYDIEAWMPGRGSFGEVSSISNCTDYQSRRLNIRYHSKDKTQYVSTLNGTACAIPRLLIAILESFQQADGSVLIPKVLQPYMGMQTVIENPQIIKTSSSSVSEEGL